MKRSPLSPAAAALYRALIERARIPANQVLLTSVRSVDWQSLIFSGERHLFELKLSSADAAQAARALCEGLEEAEFAIPGQIVADIAVTRSRTASDGSVEISIEALTVEE